jgi:hypothetical protein
MGTGCPGKKVDIVFMSGRSEGGCRWGSNGKKKKKIYSREVLVSHVGFDGFTGVRYF